MSLLMLNHKKVSQMIFMICRMIQITIAALMVTMKLKSITKVHGNKKKRKRRKKRKITHS